MIARLGDKRVKSSYSSTGIPSEYQEVEYIQGSGTQYINTNVNLSSSDTVNAKFEITSSTATLADAIYGSVESNHYFVLLMRNPITARVGGSANQATATNYVLNTIYDTNLSNGTYIENGITYTFLSGSSFSHTSTPCYIMSRNQPGNVGIVSAKVYSFEIVGKFKGVPCYRKADNVIGMYDTVNNVFHVNAGTGTFTKGSDVTSQNPTQILSLYIKEN